MKPKVLAIALLTVLSAYSLLGCSGKSESSENNNGNGSDTFVFNPELAKARTVPEQQRQQKVGKQQATKITESSEKSQ